MGYPYAEATWDAATGAMYMGANLGGGNIALYIYTLISVACCVWALWKGNSNEHALYENYK